MLYYCIIICLFLDNSHCHSLFSFLLLASFLFASLLCVNLCLYCVIAVWHVQNGRFKIRPLVKTPGFSDVIAENTRALCRNYLRKECSGQRSWLGITIL